MMKVIPALRIRSSNPMNIFLQYQTPKTGKAESPSTVFNSTEYYVVIITLKY